MATLWDGRSESGLQPPLAVLPRGTPSAAPQRWEPSGMATFWDGRSESGLQPPLASDLEIALRAILGPIWSRFLLTTFLLAASGRRAAAPSPKPR